MFLFCFWLCCKYKAAFKPQCPKNTCFKYCILVSPECDGTGAKGKFRQDVKKTYYINLTNAVVITTYYKYLQLPTKKVNVSFPNKQPNVYSSVQMCLGVVWKGWLKTCGRRWAVTLLSSLGSSFHHHGDRTERVFNDNEQLQVVCRVWPWLEGKEELPFTVL